MKKDRDEFNKAFMEGDQADPPKMDDTTADATMDPAMDAGIEGEGSAPAASAAEGDPMPTGGDARAVTLAEGADPGATIEDAKPEVDYEQKYKTLQGKYNAELQRLKDEIAALKAGEGAPMMAKDGAKVEGDGYQYDESVDPTAVARARMAERDAEYAERRRADDMDAEYARSFGEDGDRIKPVASKQAAAAAPKPSTKDEGGERVGPASAPAADMPRDDMDPTGVEYNDLFREPSIARRADGGEVEGAMSGEDVMAMLEDDYGPEFVQAMAKMIDQRARQIVEEMGGEFAGGIEEKIEKIVEMSAQGLGRLHRSVLVAMRRDAEDVANSEEFTAWVESLPEAERAQAETVINEGELPDLLALFEQYDSREGEAESPEDVWAEGAAAGVKGSAPIRIPTRAPASDDDEYKRAWDAM